MAKMSGVIAGFFIGAFVGLAGGMALTPGPADAGYGVVAPPSTISNAAAKTDMASTSVPVAGNALPKAVEVARVQKVGDDFILLDSKGRVVYSSDRANQTTTIAKGVEAPLVTGYGVAVGRVEQSFQSAGQSAGN